MISYIVAATDFAPGTKYGDQYRSCYLKGVTAQGDPYREFRVVPRGNILAAYNEGLDLHAKEIAECEARGDRPQAMNPVVLIHPDCELLGPGLAAKLESVFADPTVAVAGVIGARCHPGLDWWLGEPKFGYAHHKEGEGGVYFTKGSDNEVDIIDGMFIALSPEWAARFRFVPENYADPCYHAYGEVLCAEAQIAGYRVMQVDYELGHRTTPGFAGGRDHWDRLNEAFKRRYFRHLNGLRRRWATKGKP